MAPRKAKTAGAAQPGPVGQGDGLDLVAIVEAAPGSDGDLADDVEDPPEPMPAEISDKAPLMSKASEDSRIDIWLSETRYLLSLLEHDHVGSRGEIIAYLKTRL